MHMYDIIDLCASCVSIPCIDMTPSNLKNIVKYMLYVTCCTNQICQMQSLR